MNKEIKGLLAKYINNECTVDELVQVKAILKSGLYEQEWLAVMEEEETRDLSGDSKMPPVFFNADKVLQKIKKTTVPQTRVYTYKWAIGIAATLLISFAIAYLVYNPTFSTKQQIHMVQEVTQRGQQKIITLTDGSEVILNNRSKLRYASQFVNGKRDVYLSGEAFFKVKHDVKRPFIVHANNLKVQVLGTSFNVKSYQNDKHTSVGVVTGKVGVNGKDLKKTYMLLPGNLLSYNQQDTSFRQSDVTIDEILGWQKGLLVFHQERLDEIVPELERWYDVSVQVNRQSLLKKRITASFSKKSLTEVMEILSKTAGFTYSINNNKIQIN